MPATEERQPATPEGDEAEFRPVCTSHQTLPSSRGLASVTLSLSLVVSDTAGFSGAGSPARSPIPPTQALHPIPTPPAVPSLLKNLMLSCPLPNSRGPETQRGVGVRGGGCLFGHNIHFGPKLILHNCLAFYKTCVRLSFHGQTRRSQKTETATCP